ncbi:unnamed protein product [Amoebophrya sp. A120]|nr:unnamed protein product [Amoebophrya sp. A120]|eukprot:GSA120T00008264001.1
MLSSLLQFHSPRARHAERYGNRRDVHKNLHDFIPGSPARAQTRGLFCRYRTLLGLVVVLASDFGGSTSVHASNGAGAASTVHDSTAEQAPAEPTSTDDSSSYLDSASDTEECNPGLAALFDGPLLHPVSLRRALNKKKEPAARTHPSAGEASAVAVAEPEHDHTDGKSDTTSQDPFRSFLSTAWSKMKPTEAELGQEVELQAGCKLKITSLAAGPPSASPPPTTSASPTRRRRGSPPALRAAPGLVAALNLAPSTIRIKDGGQRIGPNSQRIPPAPSLAQSMGVVVNVDGEAMLAEKNASRLGRAGGGDRGDDDDDDDDDDHYPSRSLVDDDEVLEPGASAGVVEKSLPRPSSCRGVLCGGSPSSSSSCRGVLYGTLHRPDADAFTATSPARIEDDTLSSSSSTSFIKTSVGGGRGGGDPRGPGRQNASATSSASSSSRARHNHYEYLGIANRAAAATTSTRPLPVGELLPRRAARAVAVGTASSTQVGSCSDKNPKNGSFIADERTRRRVTFAAGEGCHEEDIFQSRHSPPPGIWSSPTYAGPAAQSRRSFLGSRDEVQQENRGAVGVLEESESSRSSATRDTQRQHDGHAGTRQYTDTTSPSGMSYDADNVVVHGAPPGRFCSSAPRSVPALHDFVGEALGLASPDPPPGPFHRSMYFFPYPALAVAPPPGLEHLRPPPVNRNPSRLPQYGAKGRGKGKGKRKAGYAGRNSSIAEVGEGTSSSSHAGASRDTIFSSN